MSKILQAGQQGFTNIYTLSDPITGDIRYVGKADMLGNIINDKYLIL